MGWLQDFFCKDIRAQLVACVREGQALQFDKQTLQLQIEDLSKELRRCRSDHTSLQAHAAQLNKTITELRGKLSDCAAEKEALGYRVRDLKADIDYFMQRVDALTEALSGCIHIDAAEVDEDELYVVEPYQHPLLGAVDPVTKKMVYDLLVADLEYYALPYDTWIRVLAPIQGAVEDTLGKWLP